MGKLGKLSFCLLASLWLVACAVPTSLPTTETPPTPTRVPPSATPMPLPTITLIPSPTPQPPTFVDPSFDGQFIVTCTEGVSMRLHTASNNKTIWGFTSPDVICVSEGVGWAKTKHALVFITEEAATRLGKVYFWTLGDSEPILVSTGYLSFFPKWNNNDERLAWLEQSKAGEDSVAVISTADKTIQRFKLKDVDLTFAFVNWATADVIEISDCGAWSCAHYQVDASTGQQYPIWTLSFDASQPPFYSPDSRWRITDSSYRRWKGEPFGSPDYLSHTYEVLDFSTGRSYALLESAQQYLQLVGWRANSETFYLVNRLAEADSSQDGKLPLGLLALEVAKGQITLLFEQAVFAQLSPDQALTWVAFPVKREDGTVGLDGGVFDLAAGTLAARQYVADEVYYGNPVEGALLPVAWNHAGTRLVFANAKGELTLVNVNGETQTLTASLPIGADWRRETRLEWSPDDARLLVQSGSRAWVVEVP